MSEGKQDSKEIKVNSDIQKVVRVDGKDWFLQNLIEYSNKIGLSFSVTVIVGGSVISGQTISGRSYFERFTKLFSDPLKGQNIEIAQAFADEFESYAKIYDDKESTEPPGYIHLRDVFIIQPNSRIPTGETSNILWRGRVDAIDGFSIGSFGPVAANTLE